MRILGEVTAPVAETLRLADHIFIEELRKAGWMKTSQAFAVFLPVKSVGVTGDGRRHEPVIALRAQDTTPDIIALDRVSKRFPGVLASDAVSLVIRNGEVHVLLGENGAGKSTLIDMLSGVQQPDSGRILVDGVVTTITSPRYALLLGIGTVFQHTMLVPSLTVAENLLLGAPWWQRPER